jgi:hypothetical protein
MSTKKKTSGVLALALVTIMSLSLIFAAATALTGGIKAYADTTSDKIGTANIMTLGTTYTLAGCEWMAVEKLSDTSYVILMTKGNSSAVQGGAWPGYIKNSNSNSSSSIENANIASYYAGHTTVYNTIKSAEASNGHGLYLIPKTKASGYYLTALKTAAGNYSTFSGATGGDAWLGTVYGSDYAYFVGSNGNVVSYSYQTNTYVVAPAFNLDLSKVKISGTTITVGNGVPTGMTITQSITKVAEGTAVDLTEMITGVAYSGTYLNGVSTSYTVTATEGNGTINGTTWTAPAGMSKDKVVTLTVTDTVYNLSKNITVTVSPGITTWTERGEYIDEEGFYTFEDSSTNIAWKYLYDNDGNIAYLYTKSDVAGIISDSKMLVVPSSINGVPVVGIGGGGKDGTTIPFVPSTSGDDATVNNTWKSIYIPSSVKVINDGAFAENGASAAITIPGTVSYIGVNAFKDSAITSVTFNDVTSLTLSDESFENTASLTTVTIRGSGLTIGSRAFKNTGITQISIPNGTKFAGNSGQNGSAAFDNSSALTLIQIDTDVVYSGIFTDCPNVATVIFGENVTHVNYDWMGTASVNNATLSSTVDRSTYVMNSATVFEAAKATESGNSPFGYKGNATVIVQSVAETALPAECDTESDPVTATAAYLTQNYALKGELVTLGKYYKGSCDSLIINASDSVASESAVTAVQTTEQTGIEATYGKTLLYGKTLDKSIMNVYKIFGTVRGEKYSSDGFYAVRTTDKESAYAETGASIEEYLKEHDTVTITQADINKGTIDITVIAPVYVDGYVNKIASFTCALAIPVKAYTAEDDFLENYGSYEAVINEISNLETNVSNLEAKNNELQSSNDSLQEKADLADEYKEEVENLKADYVSIVKQLNAYITGTEDITAENVSPKAVEAAITQAVTDLSNLNGRISALDESINTLYDDLIAKCTELGISLPSTTDGDEDDADKELTTEDKIASIGTMVDGITDAYNDLTLQYTALENKYNTIVTYIYGSGNEPEDEVSAADIENKIASNQSAASEAAVNEALTAAAEADGTAETVQKNIGETITAILDGEDVNTDELPEELKTALEDVQSMQSDVTAMQGKISGYESELSSIKSALNLSNTATSAQVLAAIQNLNSTIKSLQTENTSLKSENATLKSENERLKATATSSITTTTPSTTTTGSANTVSSAYVSQLTSQVDDLSDEVSSLSTSNRTLTSKVSTLQTKLSTLQSANDSLTSQLTDAQNQLATTQDQLASTTSQLEDTNAQLTAATDETSSLQSTVSSLNGRVASLTNQVSQATAESSGTDSTTGTDDSKAVVEVDDNITGTTYVTSSDTSDGTTDLTTPASSNLTDLTNSSGVVTKATYTSQQANASSGELLKSDSGDTSSSGGMSAGTVAVATVGGLGALGGLGFGTYKLVAAKAAAGGGKKIDLDDVEFDEGEGDGDLDGDDENEGLGF